MCCAGRPRGRRCGDGRGDAARAASAHGSSADLVVHNGRVLVLDRGFRVAEAVAVRGGRVVAVGSTRDVRRLAGRRTGCSTPAAARCCPGSTTRTCT